MDAPTALRSFYGGLGIIKLDLSVILDPACYSGLPFRLETLQLCASLVLLGTLLIGEGGGNQPVCFFSSQLACYC